MSTKGTRTLLLITAETGRGCDLLFVVAAAWLYLSNPANVY
jgi:hypothetical protein